MCALSVAWRAGRGTVSGGGAGHVTATKGIRWISHGPAELCFILMEAQELSLES